MKHTTRNRLIYFGSTVGLGLLSFFLHRYMMTACVDAKGLLIPGNLPGKLLWVCGIAMALILWRLVKTLGGNGSYADNFPRSVFAGLFSVVAGAVLLGAVAEISFDARWQYWLALAASCAMMLAGVFRAAGKRPFWLLQGLVCLFFVNTLIRNYQSWSADPQIHDYAYPLLAGVLLMLASFHRTCCDAGLLQRKKLIVTCSAAAFCALAAMGDTIMPRFYLAAALWALGSVCQVGQLPPDPEPEAPTAEAPADAGKE